MKNKVPLQMVLVVILGLTAWPLPNSIDISAQEQRGRSLNFRFEHYRMVIKDSFQIDIKQFKQTLNGGSADGKPVTDYDLNQLLEGIKWEREHATDNFVALEIAMDHLERIPDYYSRLQRLESEAMSDRQLRM